MWPFEFIDYSDVIEFNVQKLVHTLQRATNGYVVLKLDSHFMVDKRLEETDQSANVSYMATKSRGGAIPEEQHVGRAARASNAGTVSNKAATLNFPLIIAARLPIHLVKCLRC